MMSGQVIAQLAREQARKAARAHSVPFMVWQEDVRCWTQAVEDRQLPQLPFPNIGSYRPKGYKLVQTYFVDKTGLDHTGPALHISAFVNKIRPNFAYAIIEEGEFQLVIGEFSHKESDN